MNKEVAQDRERRGVIIWQPANVYDTAILGNNVSIGTFSEVGHGVVIGDNVRVGAQCFIPGGVTLEKDAWIGPRCTFTNDRFPPSPRDVWEKTIVQKGARLGAAVTVVCGVTIGEGALVGAGSTVTKDIPAGEVWAGCPAKFLKYVNSEGGNNE